MTGIDTAPEILPSPAAPHGRWRSARETALLYVLSVFGALAISAVLVAMTGNSWPGVFKALFDGAVLAPGRWGNTLTIAMPMLLVAVGTTVAVRAGLFNIGQEGQLLMGAMLMAVVGTKIEGPGVLLLLGGLALGSVAGGAYAGISAVMRYRRGVPEVISTLLLVFIALQVTGFAVTTACQVDTANPGSAVSPSVGSSGATAERVAVVTARARSLPDLTRLITSEMLANITCALPASRSCTAGGPPL